MRLTRLFPALALAGVTLLAGCGGGGNNPPGAPGGGAAAGGGGAAPAPPAKDPEAGIERTLQPLPDNAFKAQLTVASPPAKLLRGQREIIVVRVKNTSGAEWPMRGRAGDGIFQVNVGDRWIAADGKDVKVDERVFLPRAVKPGEEFEVEFGVVAPDTSGDYTVEFDVVQEGVAWFRQKGSQPASVKVKVE
ncbi:MAG TPA: hypothetical protein VF736_20945 [Pyrinomonadaceae bacterium]|jgi:hypothetical protein